VSSPATRTTRRRQRLQSRQAILDAAERRLRAEPFHALSVDAIMTDTGLSRTLFYRHFADLPDVVLQLLLNVGAELMEVSENWVRAVDSEPIGRESVSAIVDFFVQHGTLIRAITDAARYDPEIEEVYGTVIERFVDMTAGAIESLKAGGRTGPPHVRETARALTAMNEQYLLTTFGRSPAATDPASAVDALWSVWQRTIYAEHEE
jgi:AcrR family transcriptional regulator